MRTLAAGQLVSIKARLQQPLHANVGRHDTGNCLSSAPEAATACKRCVRREAANPTLKPSVPVQPRKPSQRGEGDP
jgi:hypothetical protein